MRRHRRSWGLRLCSRFCYKGEFIDDDDAATAFGVFLCACCGHCSPRRHDPEPPEEGQVIRMHYEGRLPSGRVFECSRDRGRAFQFRLGAGQVIRGLEYACTQLTRGARARVRIPPELAYGAAGRLPKIPPHSALDFDLQIIDFYTPDVDLTPRDDFDDA